MRARAERARRSGARRSVGRGLASERGRAVRLDSGRGACWHRRQLVGRREVALGDTYCGKGEFTP